MSHLRVEKRKGRRHNGPGQWCESGCSTTQGYRRSASHVAWVIGRPTYICSQCAADWERIWDEALRNWQPVEKAAA